MEVAANSLAGLRAQLVQLQQTRESLDPTTKEAQELNTKILELRTTIQQGEGVIDEFGERVKKNIKAENFDTVTDAVQGMVGAFSVATLVLGDNTDAAAAQAKALQLMTIAQSARSIAIGIGSAKEAGLVVLMQVRNLFLKQEAELTTAAAVSTEAHAAVAGADATAIEAQAAAAALNAEAQGAGTAATAGNIVATEAQVVATESATLAQRALNLVMKLNPIGLVILAVTALVGLFLAFRNASEQTQQKVKSFAETMLRFGTPIGLVYTAIEKLYQKFALVRTVLDPLIDGFNKVAGAVGVQLRSFGEYIGLLDTAAEKAEKLSEQEYKRGEVLRAQTAAEIAYLRAVGVAESELTQQRLASIRQGIDQAAQRLKDFKVSHQTELDAIKARDKAHQDLSDKQLGLLDKLAEREKAVTDLVTEQETVKNEATERDRVARAAEAADIQNNTERAITAYRRRLEEGIASEKAALQSRIGVLDRSLALVRINSEEELALQRKRVLAQRDLDLLNLGPTLAQERVVRQKFLGQQLVEQENSRKEELVKLGLTEQEKANINLKYANKAADTRLAFSTKQAQDEAKARQTIEANAAAADTKLTVDHLRQTSKYSDLIK